MLRLDTSSIPVLSGAGSMEKTGSDYHIGFGNGYIEAQASCSQLRPAGLRAMGSFGWFSCRLSRQELSEPEHDPGGISEQ